MTLDSGFCEYHGEHNRDRNDMRANDPPPSPAGYCRRTKSGNSAEESTTSAAAPAPTTTVHSCLSYDCGRSRSPSQFSRFKICTSLIVFDFVTDPPPGPLVSSVMFPVRPSSRCLVTRSAPPPHPLAVLRYVVTSTFGPECTTAVNPDFTRSSPAPLHAILNVPSLSPIGSMTPWTSASTTR